MAVSPPHACDNSGLFHPIPNEIIVGHILPHLSLSDLATKVALVNMRFRDLSMDPSLWTELELPVQKMTREVAIKVLDRCCRMLRKLTVEGLCEGFLVPYALEKCPQLEHLSLSGISKEFEPQFWNALRKSSLRKLLLTGNTPWDPSSVTDNAAALRNITHLNVYDMDDRSLMAVGDNCKQLVYFRLYSSMRDQSFDHFFENVKGTLKHFFYDDFILNVESPLRNLGKCKLLETLKISRINEEGMRIIMELPNLRSLRVGEIASDRAFFNNCSGSSNKMKLKHLELFDIYMLDDKGIRAIADYCPNLTHLALYKYTWAQPAISAIPTDAASLTYLVSKCEKLEGLYLEGMNRLVDAANFTEAVKFPRKMEVSVLDTRRQPQQDLWVNLSPQVVIRYTCCEYFNIKQELNFEAPAKPRRIKYLRCGNGVVQRQSREIN